MTLQEKNTIQDIINGHPLEVRVKLRAFLDTVVVTEEKEVGGRTGQQNRALHKGFSLIAESLNMAGLDIRKVLKPDISIPWSTLSVKEYLWKPVQKLMTQKESTTELSKTKDIDETWEVVMRFLMENHHIDYIPFPVDEKVQEENLKNYKLASTEVRGDYPEQTAETLGDKF